MSDLPVPDDWEIKPLEDVVDILDRHRIPVSAKERAKRPGTVPYYGATGQVGTIDEKLFDEPLVLLGEDGVPFLDPLASKAYLIDGPAWVNNHAHVLRVADSLDRAFLKYWLDVVNYRGHVNGTTRLKLTQAAMRRLPAPVPPLAEQRVIVEAIERMISHLDAARADIHRAHRRLMQLQGSALERLIRESRHYGSETPLEHLWRTARYGTSERCTEDGRGMPVLRIPNVRNRRLLLTDLKHVADSAANVENAVVDAGDLLIIRTNGSKALIGRTAVVPELEERFACASYLIRLRLDDTRVEPAFVAAALEAPSIRSQLEKLAASSAGQYNLSVAKLKQISLPVPSHDVQRRLLDELGQQEIRLSRLTSTAESTNAWSATLRRSVLKAAFEGRLTSAARNAQSLDDLQEAIA